MNAIEKENTRRSRGSRQSQLKREDDIWVRKVGSGNRLSRPGIEDELSTCGMRLSQILSHQPWESNTHAPNYAKTLEKFILKTWIIVFLREK